MKGIINLWLGFVLLVGVSNAGYSQDRLHYDSAQIIYLEIDQDMINQYRDHPDFQYQISQPKVQGWWGQFIDRLKRHLLSLLRISNDSGLLTWVFYIVLAGSMLFLTLKMLGMDLYAMTVKKSTLRQLSSSQLNDNHIQTMDFDSLIARHVAEKDYRQAVRLFYLFALRKLSDKEKIRWQPGKTNKEYLLELGPQPYSQSFMNLSYYFEYIWYGNFGVPDTLLQNVQSLFKQFTKELEEPK